MGKSLVSQVLGLIGKNWSKASLTREALLQHAKQFSKFMESKFGMNDIQNLKTKHIEAYVRDMQARNLSAGTIANRLTALRTIAKAIGKVNIVERTNAAYSIKRTRMNPIQANTELIGKIRSELAEKAVAGDRIAKMCHAAAELRDAFGLRAKESLKTFKVVEREGKLYLQVEGAKCGRPRDLEVRTEAQLRAVQLAAEVSSALGSGTGRIMPPEMSLKGAVDAQRTLWRKLGGTKENNANMHAQRHERFQTMKSEGVSNADIMKEAGHGEARSPGHYIPK
ncbi:phage integrase N-terminal domain-containing protein [Geobacter sp. FeAm09]|uniref:phage integrase N-terminal domain-containing protein n=1 Tax=Geobacter sp. FeAm09 TaxID=2597769 RepID=UPI00143D2E6C|nr:phage integrase N-terminal domain-containing protein [Geobacter sp. FeAm09]